MTKSYHPNSTKLALLLTPRIGALGKKGLAGTERIFCDDISQLNKRHFQVTAYARFFSDKPQINIVCRLPLHKYIETGYFAGNLIMRHVCRFLRFLEDSYYFLRFIHKVDKASIVIGYSCPSLLLFRPHKTIIIMQSIEPAWLVKLFYQRYRQGTFLFCSHNLKQQFLKLYPKLSSNHLSVLYNAIDHSFYLPSSKPIPSRQLHLLYASAWVPQKGLHLVLEALAKMSPDSRKHLHLTIASDEKLWYQDAYSPWSAYQKKLRQELSDKPYITCLHGVLPQQMPLIYANHDYLLFPSIWEEPFGLIILESLASGLPVIAFAKGAIPEIVSAHNALIVNPATVDKLTEVFTNLTPHKTRKPKTNLLVTKNQVMLWPYRYRKLVKYIDKLSVQS
jgi:glycosyltransferase involved in cell wall biosynthesis